MKLKALLPLVIVALLCSATKTEAQYYFYNEDYYDDPIIYEAGMSLGVMNCLTDLGGNKGLGKKFIKDLNMGKTRFAASLYFNATYKMSVGLRFEGTIGQVAADDAILYKYSDQESKNRYNRNLRFKSKIAEGSLIAEIYPTYLFRKFDTDVEPPRASPYLMIGVGIFHFNPRGSTDGRKWVDLQPLHTEGEGFPVDASDTTGFDENGVPFVNTYPAQYNLTQINIPMGIGLRYEAGPKLNIRAEILYRHLNTDYLDDVSGVYANPSKFAKYLPPALVQDAINLSNQSFNHQFGYQIMNIRGNPDNKDAYFTFNIKVGYILGRKRLE
jgi:hypothetical protein